MDQVLILYVYHHVFAATTVPSPFFEVNLRYFWWLLAASFIFTAAGMYSLFRGGAPHENERILDPTVFDRPEQIGAAIFRRCYPQIREAKAVVLVGQNTTAESASVWAGLRKMAAERGINGAFFNQVNITDVAELTIWKARMPDALIIFVRPYDERRAKKIDRKKLTASAEIDADQMVNVFINFP